MISTRSFNLILFLICCASIAGAYYLQFFQATLPCCLCVIQRLALIGLAISFLACALQRPKQRGLWIYTLINLFLVSVGLITSGRQIWLQNQPVSQHNMCMPVLPSTIDHSSVMKVLNNLGTQQCAEAGPYFLGVSLSLWTFLIFTLLGVVILMMPLLFNFVFDKNKKYTR